MESLSTPPFRRHNFRAYSQEIQPVFYILEVLGNFVLHTRYEKVLTYPNILPTFFHKNELFFTFFKKTCKKTCICQYFFLSCCYNKIKENDF